MALGKSVRTEIYQSIESKYKKETRVDFKWAKGEKTKLISALKEFSLIDQKKKAEQSYEFFISYIDFAFDQWMEWNKANRYNLIGYIKNPDRMARYILAHRKQGGSSVGSQTEDDWDF